MIADAAQERDDALMTFEDSYRLARNASRRLATAEVRLERLMRIEAATVEEPGLVQDASGAWVLDPFDPMNA